MPGRGEDDTLMGKSLAEGRAEVGAETGGWFSALVCVVTPKLWNPLVPVIDK